MSKKSSFVEYNANEDDDMSNTGLISSNYDPTDRGEEDDQKNLPCCWCFRPDLSAFCRFRIFYFIYYIAYQCGILFITKEFAKQLNTQDDYDTYNSIFMAIAAFICFLFSIFLGTLSDINGRQKYIRYTIIVTIIPFLAVLIYPNIWLYFGLLPLFGFVGSTTVLTGLFTTYLIDIIPTKYIAAGFASIHSIEGSAGLCALALVGLLRMQTKDNYRIGLGAIFGIFMLAFLLGLCCIKESLPLQKRNIKSQTNNKWKCFQIFISTLKQNKLLFFITILYFCILFPFQGIEALIKTKSDFELLFKGDFSGVLFIILAGGVIVGKWLNPPILCCISCCVKKIFWKVCFFMMLLIIALVCLIVMAIYKPDVDAMINGGVSSVENAISFDDCDTWTPSYAPTMDRTYYPTTPYPTYPTFYPVVYSDEPTLEPTIQPTIEPTSNYPTITRSPSCKPTESPTNFAGTHSDPNAALYGFIFAFVSGLVFAWSKLLLPLINVLVRGSSNKLEKGKTFGVLSSIESVCTYIGPLAVISLWETNFSIIAFVLCIVLVVLGFIWLWVKLKRTLLQQRSIFVEYNPESEEQERENQGLSDQTGQGLFVL